MSELLHHDLRRSVATPQTIAVRQVMADGIIAVAAKAKDWPLLHEAVDIKIEDQREFVREWDEIFAGRGGDRRLVTERVTSYAEQIGISKMQVSRWRKSLENPDVYHDKLVLAACRKAGLEPEENHRAEGTGENEWFTPTEYIEAAREVMGGIDLDPATHEVAQRTVQAAEYFTAKDDGLKLSWHGRVWLNPPYAQPYIAQFVAKLVAEFSDGSVEQAILLTHNYTDTTWFHQAEASASLLCFTRGRIRFVDPDGGLCAPTQGQAFFYFGGQAEKFREAFSRFGFVR